MNSSKLNLIMNIIKIGLAVIGILLCVFLFGGPNMENTVEEQQAFRDGTQMSLAVSFTGFVVFAGIGLILLFFVFQLITNPKKTVMSIIGLIVAAVLYVIFLMLGTSDTNESLALRDPVALSTISTTTAGIITVIAGLAIGVLAVAIGPFIGRYRK